MCTSQRQRGPCEAASATGHGKLVYELGQDTSGYSKNELRQIIDGLVGRIGKLERELERSQQRGQQAGKRKGQRPRGEGGDGEPAYRKPPDDRQVTDEQERDRACDALRRSEFLPRRGDPEGVDRRVESKQGPT